MDKEAHCPDGHWQPSCDHEEKTTATAVDRGSPTVMSLLRAESANPEDGLDFKSFLNLRPYCVSQSEQQLLLVPMASNAL